MQPGDENLESVAFSAIAGRHLVVEEKMDGANAAISFTTDGRLLLQSRGHYLTGGPRERHFALFKQWAQSHSFALHQILGGRYVLYGEWMYAKHTVFYDRLPHYFLEFDIFDTENNVFLDTPRRRSLLRGTPVASIHVLHSGTVKSVKALAAWVGPSQFISADHLTVLAQLCRARGLDPDRCVRETDPSTDREGLYIKVEENGEVVERYKFVRASFLTAILNSEGHWVDRPIVPNLLAEFSADFGTGGIP